MCSPRSIFPEVAALHLRLQRQCLLGNTKIRSDGIEPPRQRRAQQLDLPSSSRRACLPGLFPLPSTKASRQWRI
jgi:hypothetical protein